MSILRLLTFQVFLRHSCILWKFLRSWLKLVHSTLLIPRCILTANIKTTLPAEALAILNCLIMTDCCRKSLPLSLHFRNRKDNMLRGTEWEQNILFIYMTLTFKNKYNAIARKTHRILRNKHWYARNTYKPSRVKKTVCFLIHFSRVL
jgi:hypothetical protein